MSLLILTSFEVLLSLLRSLQLLRDIFDFQFFRCSGEIFWRVVRMPFFEATGFRGFSDFCKFLYFTSFLLRLSLIPTTLMYCVLIPFLGMDSQNFYTLLFLMILKTLNVSERTFSNCFQIFLFIFVHFSLIELCNVVNSVKFKRAKSKETG